MQERKDFRNRKVRLILQNNFKYSGLVLEDSESHLIILDKFNKEIYIPRSEIKILEVMQ